MVYTAAAVGGQSHNPMSEQSSAHLLMISDVLGLLVLDANSNRVDCHFVDASGVASENFTMFGRMNWSNNSKLTALRSSLHHPSKRCLMLNEVFGSVLNS